MDINISINVPQQPGGEHLPVNIEAFAQDLRDQGIDVRVSGPQLRLLSDRLAALNPDGAWIAPGDLAVLVLEAQRLEELLLREQAYVAAGHRKIQELHARNRALEVRENQAASADPVVHLRDTVEATMRLLSRITLRTDMWHLDLDVQGGLRVMIGALHFGAVRALSRPDGTYCVVVSQETADGDVQQKDTRFTDDLEEVRAWLIDWVAQIVYSD